MLDTRQKMFQYLKHFSSSVRIAQLSLLGLNVIKILVFLATYPSLKKVISSDVYFHIQKQWINYENTHRVSIGQKSSYLESYTVNSH